MRHALSTILLGVIFGVLCFCGSASAMLIYNDETSFLRAIAGNYYLEEFDGFIGGVIPPSFSFGPINGYEL